VPYERIQQLTDLNDITALLEQCELQEAELEQQLDNCLYVRRDQLTTKLELLEVLPYVE
jgi:hypothetical protein